MLLDFIQLDRKIIKVLDYEDFYCITLYMLCMHIIIIFC